MSAVEQYRRGSRSRHLKASWALEQEADAAIAELEAENNRLKTALVAIQSTAPGSAHRVAIQALAERSTP